MKTSVYVNNKVDEGVLNLLDAGYIGWKYGLFDIHLKEVLGSLPQGVLICDSATNWRKYKEFDYKSNRKGKNEEERAKVRSFVEQLKENTPYVQFNDLEADDLIGVICTLRSQAKKKTVIYSLDKDFSQLHNKYTTQKSLEEREITVKHNKSMMPLSHSHLGALALAVHGDKIDNIETLHQPRNFGWVNEIIAARAKPYTRAYELFGVNFIRNLHLVLLPPLFCANHEYRMEEMLEQLDKNEYREKYDVDNEIYGAVRDCL